MEKKTVGQKVKGHFKKHKVKYIIGGACLTAGVVIGVVVSDSDSIKIGNNGIAIGSKIITTDVNLTRRGHAGDVIRCLETGETFASQKRAAKVYGVNQGDISKHLKGKKDNVKGLTFEKVGSFNKEGS